MIETGVNNVVSFVSTGIINIIFTIAKTMIQIILAPIDIIVSRFLPNVTLLTTHINNFLNYAFSSIGWVIDFVGIPKEILQLIVSYFTLKYTIYFAVYTIKIVVGWIKK